MTTSVRGSKLANLLPDAHVTSGTEERRQVQEVTMTIRFKADAGRITGTREQIAAYLRGRAVMEVCSAIDRMVLGRNLE